MISEEAVKKYCDGDISKIENYDEAISDKDETWDCHHRFEISPNGNFSVDTLKKYCLYYNRPAEELIFLKHSEHISLHTTGKKLSVDQKKKMSLAKKGNKNPFYGKRFSEEHRRKISQSHKGKILSVDTRQKMSISRKGNKHYLYGKHHSEDTKRKMSLAKKGIPKSAETRIKMSLAKKGIPKSAETKQKMSLAQKA